jgi:hypothetical protein
MLSDVQYYFNDLTRLMQCESFNFHDYLASLFLCDYLSKYPLLPLEVDREG